MSFKYVWLAGLLILGASAANAQIYWSTDPNLNCGSYGGGNGGPGQLESGPGAGGYVCGEWGILPWYASGAGWASTIRVSAPTTAPVSISLYFSDVNGDLVSLDFRYHGDTTVYSGTGTAKALYANQPLQVTILGLHSEAPSYGSMASGSVTVDAFCPDPQTCSLIQAQLIYSALPFRPWSLSAPIVWDRHKCYGWSSVGVDDGSTNTVSFVITNLDSEQHLPHMYALDVYDSSGNLYSSGNTRLVPLYGSYGDLVRNVVPKLPSGPFKLQVVGHSWMAFEALQFQGPSATTLVASWEVPFPSATPNGMPGGSRHLSPSARLWRLPHTDR